MTSEKEVLSYEGFGVAVRELAQTIAGDVADTGATLKLVREFCGGHVAVARSAVLYSKPHSIETANYSWKSTDKWIEFPCSVQPPVVTRT